MYFYVFWYIKGKVKKFAVEAVMWKTWVDYIIVILRTK